MKVTELYQKTAEDILTICDQTAAIPVDIKQILEKLEISAFSFDFTEIEKRLPAELADKNILGALVSAKDSAAILYSSRDKQDSHRMRFTIAHELAHCCLHGMTRHIQFRMDGALNEQEIAANTFAGELLIPELSLKKVIRKLLVPTVAALADIFDVSINVMNERIRHLSLEDQIVGVST